MRPTPKRAQLFTVVVSLLLVSCSNHAARPVTRAALQPVDDPAPVEVQATVRQTATSQEIVKTYLYGVINDDGHHFADEWAQGVRATTFEFQWKRYEPQPGIIDTNYVQHMKQVLAELKTQGWFVQMIPGFQYVPEWVFQSFPNVYFVNQYGDAYTPQNAPSFEVINAPFNPQARALIATYLNRIFTDFNQSDPLQRFDSVRIGGVVQGELRYPPETWNGNANSFWAFDAYAQDPSISGIPADVVGWRPGIDPNPGSTGREQLLVNPGFEKSAAILPVLGWSPDDEVRTERSVSQPHSGNRSLKLTLSSPHRIHQIVRVQPGGVYSVGGWLRAEENGKAARVFITQYDASQKPVPGAPIQKLEAGNQDWTEKSVVTTATAATRFLRIELDGSRPGVYWFDDLWVTVQGATDPQSRDVSVPLAFYSWYVEKLKDYQSWQISEMRKYTTAQLDLIYPGKGVLANQVNDALTNDLIGDGWSEENSGLYAGTDYKRIIAALPADPGLSVFLTGIDEPAANRVDDSSPYPRDWSAARWLSYLASDRGLPIWGENSGQDGVEAMKLSVLRMRQNGFSGLMWGFESELYSDQLQTGFASMRDYAALIARYQNRQEEFLPALRR